MLRGGENGRGSERGNVSSRERKRNKEETPGGPRGRTRGKGIKKKYTSNTEGMKEEEERVRMYTPVAQEV